MKLKAILLLSMSFCVAISFAQHNHNHDGAHDHTHSHGGHTHDHGDHSHSDDHKHNTHVDGDNHASHEKNNFITDCGSSAKVIHHHEYDPTATALHHISDANVLTIMDAVRIPLPAIIYNKERGFEIFSTGKFHPSHHDNGEQTFKDYVLFEGNIHRITCDQLNLDTPLKVEGFDRGLKTTNDGKEIENKYAIINGKGYLLEAKTTYDANILGGGPTSFIDFSPTKNVVTMFLVSLLLFFLFRKAANAYVTRDGQAPSGIQSFFEPVIQFIRDDVAIPFLGEKYDKYLPLLLTIFFFILGLNLWGQVPFLGSVNVTGSLTVTAVMAILVFVITNFSGNADYWKHILWPPNTPVFVKIILIPVEILGLFIKPITLMLRLAGNISAGHIAILSFVGLIFIFGKAGQSMTGSLTGTAIAIPLTLFMMGIELIVAFIQAFVFTILTASYIGAATEEHHHDDH